MVPFPRRLPHTISPLEGDGFEPSVPEGESAAVGTMERGVTRPCTDVQDPIADGERVGHSDAASLVADFVLGDAGVAAELAADAWGNDRLSTDPAVEGAG